MKKIKTIILLLLVISATLLFGCGGGGGSSSGGDDPEPSTAVTFTQKSLTNKASGFTLVLTASQVITNPTVTSPQGYTASVSNKTVTIKGAGIANSTDANITKTFTLSYTYDDTTSTSNIKVSITPNDIGQSTTISIVKPTTTYGDAYLLKYSSSNHIIKVTASLPTTLKTETLSYEWHLDSTSGYKLQNTDSVYNSAEFIYRPKDTSDIPADVTTGVSRQYNRGFKANFYYNNKTIIGHYIYLLVKDSNSKTLSTFKFYVGEPETPPTPSK